MNLPDKISISWHINDIKGQNSSLTDNQAREVLKELKRRHDACLGINWDVIDCTIEEYLSNAS